ncbi:MAG: hypothetical protein AAGF83_23375 [Cyanobacteria bacterium P01_G01_bin.67]
MLKNLLRLLATSSSLVALLLLTNSAISFAGNGSFAPASQRGFEPIGSVGVIAANPIDTSVNYVESAVVSLNVVAPTLQLHGNFHDEQLADLGCGCAVCTQASKLTHNYI